MKPFEGRRNDTLVFCTKIILLILIMNLLPHWHLTLSFYKFGYYTTFFKLREASLYLHMYEGGILCRYIWIWFSLFTDYFKVRGYAQTLVDSWVQRWISQMNILLHKCPRRGSKILTICLRGLCVAPNFQ